MRYGYRLPLRSLLSPFGVGLWSVGKDSSRVHEVLFRFVFYRSWTAAVFGQHPGPNGNVIGQCDDIMWVSYLKWYRLLPPVLRAQIRNRDFNASQRKSTHRSVVNLAWIRQLRSQWTTSARKISLCNKLPTMPPTKVSYWSQRKAVDCEGYYGTPWTNRRKSDASSTKQTGTSCHTSVSPTSLNISIRIMYVRRSESLKFH